MSDTTPLKRRFRFKKVEDGTCRVVGCGCSLLPDRFGSTVTITRSGRNFRICSSHTKDGR
jgi:hypothetical protein